MAVAKVNKILLVCHNSEKEELLSSLQRAGIVHITKIKERGEEEKPLWELIQSAEEAISFLERAMPKGKKGMTEGKVEIRGEEFFPREDIPSLIEEVKSWRERMNFWLEREKEIENELALLLPFASLPHPLEDLYSLEKMEILLGYFPNERSFAGTVATAEEKGILIQEISREGDKVFSLVLFLKETGKEIKDHLLAQNFRIIDLKRYSGTVKENIAKLNEEKNSLAGKKRELTEKVKDFHSFLPRLKIGRDYYQNVKIRKEVENYLRKTESAIIIEGWVKEREKKELENLVARFETATLLFVSPEPGEEPPVALENKKAFQPFEMVVNLYGMPSYQEIDPTPYLTPFFIIFFALCLSDAAYGIIIFLLSLLLIRRFRKAKNFLTLLAVCGVATIFAGAITNSWFGDILERIGIPSLKNFKDRLVLFDPFQNPLIFFYLSLGLGFIHLNYGLLLEIYDSFRIKNPLPALFNEFLWLILLNSLVAYLLGAKNPIFLFLISVSASGLITLSRFLSQHLKRHILFFLTITSLLLFLGFRFRFLPPPFQYGKHLFFVFFLANLLFSLLDNLREKRLGIKNLFLYLLSSLSFLLYLFHLVSILPFLILGIFAIFSSRINRALGKRLIWGAYNLYGGTSFLGIILSYIRLMALGMMTAGIGMAVNSIAWLVKGIPGLGIILAVIVFLLGHTYNLAVSILGAFVHTLRLNYVEFFPRFFTGGGERFTPFRLETKYVEIK